MKRIYLISLTVLMAFSSQAQFDPEAKAILDAMSAKYKSISAFTAAFTQTLSNETADLNESVDGVITIKDIKYKLELAGQEIFNDGKDVWTYNAEIKEATVSEYVADDQEISLNNIWDLYRDGYKYILMSTDKNGNNIIDLDPVDRSKTFYKVRMVISAKNELKSFNVFEISGNQFRYEIREFTTKNDLQDSFFAFVPEDYPGVEIIDFR